MSLPDQLLRFCDSKADDFMEEGRSDKVGDMVKVKTELREKYRDMQRSETQWNRQNFLREIIDFCDSKVHSIEDSVEPEDLRRSSCFIEVRKKAWRMLKNNDTLTC